MEFLTKNEVAKYFRVHPKTVERWLKSKDLIGYKLGDGNSALWRIDKKEVKKFLEKYKNNLTTHEPTGK
ncbi:MAG: helix-turn-helix domain-containing protein [Candidatus Paceibacterota bacterium]|jgi:excisionase family DNA binding protein